MADLTATVYLREGLGTRRYEPSLRDVASRAEEATVLVAVLDGRVAGAVTVAAPPSRWAEGAAEGEAVIRMLVVDPAARGRGIGEALVRACVQEASAAGCRRVRLSTQDDSRAAHRIYRRLGFVPVPERDWEYEPGVPLRAWALELRPPGPGDAARP